MKTSTKALNSMIASAFILTMGATTIGSSQAHAASKEKCYGVVKAGKNGCGDAAGKHSCEGQAAIDGSGQEWISLPKGACAKIVGGSVKPFAGTEAPMKKEGMMKKDG